MFTLIALMCFSAPMIFLILCLVFFGISDGGNGPPPTGGGMYGAGRF